MVPTVFATGSPCSRDRSGDDPGDPGHGLDLGAHAGPSVGGWITEVADWRWLFFINIVPGLLVSLALPFLGKVDEARPAMLKRIDWLHVASLAVFLGALHTCWRKARVTSGLTTRPSRSPLAVAVGCVVFFERTFFSTMPVLKLTPFKRPTFAMACVLNVVIGFGLYAATYLTPVYLGRVRGYSSLQIGVTVFVTGVAMFFTAPIAAGPRRASTGAM